MAAVSNASKNGLDVESTISKSNLTNVSTSIALKKSAIAKAYESDPKAQVSALSKALDVVHTSWIGNRVELKHALRDAATAENRTQELQTQVSRLSKLVSLPVQLASLQTRALISEKEKMSIVTPQKVCNLEGKSQNDADLGAQLCAMLEQSRRDHALTKATCIRAEKKAVILGQEIGIVREQLRNAQEDAAAAQESKLHLMQLTRRQIREAEEKAFDAVQTMTQNILDNRKELLLKVRSVEDLERSLRALQDQRETQELVKWRQQAQESQIAAERSAREIKFLQNQLLEMILILLKLMNGSILLIQLLKMMVLLEQVFY